MMTPQQAKELAKLFSQEFKDSEVKNSKVLELLAQFEGYADWNTFSGVEKNKKNRPKALTKFFHIHIDNGGYSFQYDLTNKELIVETSFFGYSVNTHNFKMTIKELEKFIYAVEKFLTGKITEPMTGDCWIVNSENVTLFNEYTSVMLPFMIMQPQVKPIDILKELVDEIKNLNQ